MCTSRMAAQPITTLQNRRAGMQPTAKNTRDRSAHLVKFNYLPLPIQLRVCLLPCTVTVVEYTPHHSTIRTWQVAVTWPYPIILIFCRRDPSPISFSSCKTWPCSNGQAKNGLGQIFQAWFCSNTLLKDNQCDILAGPQIRWPLGRSDGIENAGK